MTPRTSILGGISALPVMRDAKQRRVLFAVLVALFGLLALYPEKYRAAVSLTPSDPASLGLGSALGQLGAVNSVFGNQTAVEVSLKVARSRYVRDIVSKSIGLPKLLGKDPIATDRWLEREVDIRALRGGIIQFEATLTDAEFARQLVAAYASAVRQQLAVIGKSQTAYKRKILLELVGQSSDRLVHAQAAYDTFRLKSRYSQPQAAITAIGDRIPQLESMIRGKEVELSSAREFATDNNYRIKQLLAEKDALTRQLEIARSVSPIEPNSVGRVVSESTEVDKLRRELDLAQSLYDSYKRYLQGTSVEDLTSSANVRILEPAFVDSARQYNVLPLSIALALALLGIALEFYLVRPSKERFERD